MDWESGPNLGPPYALPIAPLAGRENRKANHDAGKGEFAIGTKKVSPLPDVDPANHAYLTCFAHKSLNLVATVENDEPSPKLYRTFLTHFRPSRLS